HGYTRLLRGIPFLPAAKICDSCEDFFHLCEGERPLKPLNLFTKLLTSSSQPHILHLVCPLSRSSTHNSGGISERMRAGAQPGPWPWKGVRSAPQIQWPAQIVCDATRFIHGRRAKAIRTQRSNWQAIGRKKASAKLTGADARDRCQ